MFDHKHYVPILRWKQAERLALRDLRDDVRYRLTPLVRLVPDSIATGKRTPTVEDALRKITREMRECWGTRPIIVDLQDIEENLRVGGATHPLTCLGRHARGKGVAMVPVTSLQRDAAYQTAVSEMVNEDGRGGCLRLFRGDLRSANLGTDVERLLSRIGLTSYGVDLVVDFEFHDTSYPGFRSLCSLVPYVREWRSLAVASGAFPRDLTQWSTPGTYRVRRQDWLWWLGEIQLTDNLARRPTFADYGIYHPTYMPPPGFPNFTASIRYTSDDDWIIMRGEGVRNEGGAGFAQWPANAQMLLGMTEFRGRDFSAGDAYIASEAGNYAHPGNASTWLQAGFNHHMTFVVRQMANLFGT